MAGIGHLDVPSLTLKLDGHINLQTDLVFHSMNISTRKVTLPVFYLLCLGKTLVDKKIKLGYFNVSSMKIANKESFVFINFDFQHTKASRQAEKVVF